LEPDAGAVGVLGEALGVLRARDRLLVKEEAEAVVDALVEDAAGATVAFEDEDTGSAGAPGSDSGSEAGRAAADDDDVMALGGEEADAQDLILP
jgi:hypothetical protein